TRGGQRGEDRIGGLRCGCVGAVLILSPRGETDGNDGSISQGRGVVAGRIGYRLVLLTDLDLLGVRRHDGASEDGGKSQNFHFFSWRITRWRRRRRRWRRSRSGGC